MLNREQYEKLCSLCDKVLSEKSTKSTIAISWLHINRWHPVLLKEHKYFFDKSYKYKLLTKNIYLFLSFIFKSIYRITRSFGNFKVSKPLNLRSTEVDILFVSHLINSSEIGKSEDSYYGELPILISENGVKSAVAKINHTKVHFDLCEKNWGSEINTPRFILPKLLSSKYEIKILLDQIKEFIRLLKNSFKNSGAYKDILACSSVHALSPSTSDNIRFSIQMKFLLNQIKPKCVIVTYEGFAWERLAFSIAKKMNNKIKCIGYQQSAIFESQHSAYRDLSSEYNSDYVFTSGKITQDQIEHLYSYKSSQIKNLGSKQAQSIANKDVRKYYKTCLVAPESFTSEIMILFDFSILCAIKNPSMKFIWRLHPKITFENLMNNLPKYKDLPINIVLSKETLEYDLLRSSYILYRGSTTVIPAISFGLIPIYYKRKNELSIDPIYALKKGKITTLTEPDFETIKKELYNPDTLKSLVNYGQSYYTNFNLRTIKEILEC